MCPRLHLLGQKISANPDHEKKEKEKRIRIGWNAFSKQHNDIKSNLPLSLKRKVQDITIINAFYQF